MDIQSKSSSQLTLKPVSSWHNIKVIFKREFKSYFNSPIAYIFIIAFLVTANWLFFKPFFLINQASMRQFFLNLPWLFLFFVPAITMRMWSEEMKLGTLEMLMTQPVRDSEIVIGKFLGSFALLSTTIALTLTIPMTVSWLGNPDPGPIIGGYLGAILMGAAYIAIGLFVSSMTENQIVAFIIAITLIFGLLIIGEDFVLMALPIWIAPFCDYISLGTHFDSIGRGVIDTRDLVYYASVIGLFLWLNLRTLASRRWS